MCESARGGERNIKRRGREREVGGGESKTKRRGRDIV
jgi:hypothetical protein